jgi:uncharacterized protein YuzE
MDIPLTKDGFNVSYDKEADVLYITLGVAQPAVALMTHDGDLMRVDPETDELVGITILDFKEKHLERGYEKSSCDGGRR